MKPVLLAMPGNEAMAASLEASLDAELGVLAQRSFPDGETHLQVRTPVSGRDVVLLATLSRPNEKCLPLLFAADVLRDLGARRVLLAAPYLGYLRQDRRFQDGEAVTSVTFARVLSRHFSGLVTVDPHLHRYSSLDEIYSIPSRVITAAPLLADWVRAHVPDAVIVGPDSESEQWVSKVAATSDRPFVVLEKIRKGDRDVEIRIPGLERFKTCTPVIVDDIISTARTLIKTVGLLRDAGMRAPVCLGVHAIFAEGAFEDLKRSGPSAVVTCNTVPHSTNGIDVTLPVAAALRELLRP
jgi:ribose-phosphate pyrophosphokinase